MSDQFHNSKLWIGSGCVVAAMVAVVFLWQQNVLPMPAEAVALSRSIEEKMGGFFPEPTATAKLAVPIHYQEHALSCEAACLQMALAFYGIPVQESEIISQTPSDRTEKFGDVWGDPQLGFVGSVDGQMLRSGYGIYWQPIARVADHWASSKVLCEGTAEELAQNIAAGHPVVAWGYLGLGSKTFWITPAGKRVDAVHSEHTRVVVGFTGSVKHPDGFFVIDPIYGRQYWSRATFLRNWDAFGRCAVVVLPPVRKQLMTKATEGTSHAERLTGTKK